MKKEVFQKEGLTFVSIENEKIKLTLCTLGASIYRVEYNGITMNLTPEEKYFSIEKYYHGKTIGPIPNRMKGSDVFVDRKMYVLESNEGENTLHGGHTGYSTKVFDYQIEEKKDYTNVIFVLHLSEDDHSLPGDVTIYVKYHLEEDEESFSLVFNALSSRDTYLSLTNHTFFTLGDSNINKLMMMIPAFEYVKTDARELLPLEKERIVECLDFNEMKPLMKDINNLLLMNHRAKGYDHCFYLDDNFVVLRNDKYELDIHTNFECVQVYTDNYIDDASYCGTRDMIRRGVAIEPEDNILERTVLKGGETYYRFIKYTFRSL